MQAQSTTSPAEKRNEALKRLEAAVQAIHDSESFRAYLDMQSRFHSYSWGNVAMITMQRPDATRVAGYHKWLELHRYVKKGEKGIAILAPCVYKKKSTEENEDEEEKTGLFFKVVYVFDVSQTDGEELPMIECPELTEDSGHDLYRGLMALAHREKLSVRVVPTLDGETMGYYQPATMSIVLRQAAMLQMVKTLAHELAHHLTHDVGDNRAERECIAESIAYVVCSHFGLDTGARSFPYVAHWGQDGKTLKGVLQVIQSTSKAMIDSLSSEVA